MGIYRVNLTTIKAAACVVALGLAGAAATVSASAIATNSTGGVACKAAAGPGANVFYFSNLSAQNTSASVQYLSCMAGGAFEGTQDTKAKPTSINMNVVNPSATTPSMTCVLQSGNEGFGSINSVVKTYNLVASDTFYGFNSFATDIPNAVAYGTYTWSCGVPSQAKIAYMGVTYPSNPLAP
jgi:hypothetical protein